MWYVINKTNGIKLKKFEKMVIIPLFNHLITYKNENYTCKFDEYLEKLDELVSEKNVLQYINKNTKDYVNFSSLISDLLAKYSENEIRQHYYIYLYQNKQLKNRTSYIEKKVVPDEWIQIFKDFFYGKFFNMNGVWERIDNIPYSRDDFHTNFKSDNKIWVCPYCDSDSINNNGNLEVEHFWPESIYPFLAMNSLNLYSSCKSCNRPAEGKGLNTFNPITMPFYEQIGNNIHFKPDVVHKKIHVRGIKETINNFAKLIKLEERYSKPSIYAALEIMTSTIYTTIQEAENKGESVSAKELSKYIEQKITPRVQPLYFATADIFRDFDEYKDFIEP